MLQRTLDALQKLRAPFAFYETDLYACVEKCLSENDLPYLHEVRLGSGCRADYLVGDVCVEIKKGKPNPAVLLSQLERYAAFPQVASLIVVTQHAVSLPDSVGGKPLYSVALNVLWGVALP